ncbi:redoxin domain-containing protein [Pedobacter sp. MC2016-15]|uniref:redoxin domain-containing protein n=1 Tax=Pedobacter sp. MC2016-15 TaxID=2994473 RepID=UPI0022475AA9|nr:redoxin domain-containing protein [Pedobacter sp. MC2016-15]MCX2479379.1 redoxin domain-containing protein [Pedobacter sp. MC2016-15]
MKQINKAIILSAAAVFTLAPVVKSQSKPADTTRAYLNKLLMSKEPTDKALFNQKLQVLSASESEKDVDMAVVFYARGENMRSSDSLSAVQIKKFPLGMRARNEAAQEIFKLKTVEEKDTDYRGWIQKFNPQGNGEDVLINDYMVSSIAQEYAKKKNTSKAIEFINKLRVDFWMGNAYSGLGGAFKAIGDLTNAEIYLKKAMESAKTYYDEKLPDENSSKFAASGYPGLTMTYANLLFEMKRYKEALTYAEMVMKNPQTASPTSNYQYAKILMALNRNQEAYAKLEEAVKSGKANDEMSQAFKKLYVKVKGTEKGFDQYAAEIRKGILANIQQKLKKEMLNAPATDFVLKDIDGNTVTLSSLKGKVVILDFWATWCGPCKASFPAMQMAVNKYKADPNVKFLFIHTWERSATPTKDASEFIKSMNYKFDVLMDTKDPETKANKVVGDYKVKGIPSKFVIDPKGNIRFNLMGFEGGNDIAVEEISMMIDMARKG